MNPFKRNPRLTEVEVDGNSIKLNALIDAYKKLQRLEANPEEIAEIARKAGKVIMSADDHRALVSQKPDPRIGEILAFTTGAETALKELREAQSKLETPTVDLSGVETRLKEVLGAVTNATDAYRQLTQEVAGDRTVGDQRYQVLDQLLTIVGEGVAAVGPGIRELLERPQTDISRLESGIDGIAKDIEAGKTANEILAEYTVTQTGETQRLNSTYEQLRALAEEIKTKVYSPTPAVDLSGIEGKLGDIATKLTTLESRTIVEDETIARLKQEMEAGATKNRNLTRDLNTANDELKRLRLRPESHPDQEITEMYWGIANRVKEVIPNLRPEDFQEAYSFDSRKGNEGNPHVYVKFSLADERSAAKAQKTLRRATVGNTIQIGSDIYVALDNEGFASLEYDIQNSLTCLGTRLEFLRSLENNNGALQTIESGYNGLVSTVIEIEDHQGRKYSVGLIDSNSVPAEHSLSDDHEKPYEQKLAGIKNDNYSQWIVEAHGRQYVLRPLFKTMEEPKHFELDLEVQIPRRE